MKVSGGWRFNNRTEAANYRNLLARSIQCQVPSGWFLIGSATDAHKCGRCWKTDCGCMYGVNCDTYAWVAPGGDDAFTRFCITILALSTLDPPKPDEAMKVSSQLPREVRSTLSELHNQGRLTMQPLGVAPSLAPVAFQTVLPNGSDVSEALGRIRQAARASELRNEDLNALKDDIETVRHATASWLRETEVRSRLRAAAPTFMVQPNANQLDQLVDSIQTNAAETNKIANRALEQLESVSRASVQPPLTVLSRPGSLPLSRGVPPGVEFVPSGVP